MLGVMEKTRWKLVSNIWCRICTLVYIFWPLSDRLVTSLPRFLWKPLVVVTVWLGNWRLNVELHTIRLHIDQPDCRFALSTIRALHQLCWWLLSGLPLWVKFGSVLWQQSRIRHDSIRCIVFCVNRSSLHKINVTSLSVATKRCLYCITQFIDRTWQL